MGFDPSRRTAEPTAMPELPGRTDSVASPDGKWVAFEAKADLGQQIWLQKTGDDRAELLAGGRCVNASPTWELDSKAILFTSDCQRGVGLPALYRAKVESE